MDHQIIPKREILGDPDHIRLPEELRARIRAISEDSGQGYAACVRFLLLAGLEQYDLKNGGGR